MALKFRTRLNFTIVSLVFLVIAVLTVVVIAILSIDMWTANWRSGATINTVTTASIDQSIDLPPYLQERVAEQMELQAMLVGEIVELAEKGGDDGLSLTDRLNRARLASARGNAPVDSIVVTDAQGNLLAGSGDTPTAALDGMPKLTPGAAVESGGQAAQPGQHPEQHIYAPLPHRPGTVYIGLSEQSIKRIVEPVALETALDQFMAQGLYGSAYIRMAVIDATGAVLAAVERDGAPSSPQLLRSISAFCAKFLKDLPQMAPQDRYATQMITRDVGVVTPLELAPTGEILALYVEHDTSRQFTYIIDRVGVLLVVGAIMFTLALITSIFLSRGLSKPLIELARGAREFGAGNFNYRLRMKRKDEFSDLAQSFNTMAISIQEYVHELRQETSRRERLESEFRIAADLQQTLLPESPPRVDGIELIGWSQASKEVGGDFYDYFELPNGKIGIVLGDATGKGLGAALLSTQCSSILRTLAGQDLPPAELLAQTNNEFFKRIGSTHRFVTLFLLVLDPETGMATYASAGHPPALLTNPEKSQSRWLESEAGYPLGIVKDALFSEVTVRLEAHDTIVIYSDGLTDAQDSTHQLFGEKRLEDAVKSGAGRAPDELLTHIRAAATHHMYGKDPIDDMTIVIVRFETAAAVAAQPPAV